MAAESSGFTLAVPVYKVVYTLLQGSSCVYIRIFFVKSVKINRQIDRVTFAVLVWINLLEKFITKLYKVMWFLF